MATSTPPPQLSPPSAALPSTPPAGPAAGHGGGAVASTPTLATLRRQELQETGSGFMTQFGEQAAVLTPGPRGVGGSAATPLPHLSTLRALHKVQQLRRLQREGACLVAELPQSAAVGSVSLPAHA